MMNDQKKNLTILIVDDVQENIEILMEIIDDLCDIAVALDGISALEIVSETSPDLILLDIMMPKMDGYEVCRILKDDVKTKDIPIIFITALGSANAEEKGLIAGAIDYITKPFNPSIVRARVKNHLALCEAERIKRDVDQIIRHDLKSPLMSIINVPQLILMTEQLSDQSVELLKIVENSGVQILSLINRSLDIIKLEQGAYQLNPETVSLLPLFNRIMNELRFHEGTIVNISINFNGKPVEDGLEFKVLGDEVFCYMLFSNLIKNAGEASPSGEVITISLKSEPGVQRVTIHNQGSVPEQIRDRFFEKYITSGKRSGTGLGTYVAAMITKKLGGSIRMESSHERGTTLELSLPAVM